MKQIELIGLLIKYKTNLKALKEQLSPNFWNLFKQAVNNNDVKRADYWLSYCLLNKLHMVGGAIHSQLDTCFTIFSSNVRRFHS